MKTLEKYFHENMDRDVVDFSVRARSFGQGKVGFYIHPDSRDGETLLWNDPRCGALLPGDRLVELTTRRAATVSDSGPDTAAFTWR